MRIVLDACIIFPTVMREVLTGMAAAGAFTPLWSERIIEEWVRAAGRLGDGMDQVAAGEAALMQAQFPSAMVSDGPDMTGSLPDPGDDHVLSTAVGGGADMILTRNTKDFPLRVLGAHSIGRGDPDGFLVTCDDALLADVTAAVQAKAVAISGREQPLRPLLKRAGLPRLGKRLTQRSTYPPAS